MAKANIGKLRGMNPADLDTEELALRDEIWKLRLQRTTGQLQDPWKVRIARRKLARVKTVKSEQRIAGATSGKG